MMQSEGNAVVYCEGAFGTTNGKTAHGLVRRSDRYQVLSVIDSNRADQDAGMVLDGKNTGILIVPTLESALAYAESRGEKPTHFVIGLAPDGGRLPKPARSAVLIAIDSGLHVVSGLHDFLSEDPEIRAAADQQGVEVLDIRKPPSRDQLHFFSGKIEQVDSLKVAVLGTDSAVGKRTTAWLLKDALEAQGWSTEMVGTGQTAWLQGAKYSVVSDSIVSDFVSGEIEHAVWSAWDDRHPDVILLEGQGSLMNPAYPGGFELIAAGRPDVIIVQHAPARRDYDGFPGYRIHPLHIQIQALELISGKSVVAVTLNHERLTDDRLAEASRKIARNTRLTVCSPLKEGCDPLVRALKPYLEIDRRRRNAKLATQ